MVCSFHTDRCIIWRCHWRRHSFENSALVRLAFWSLVLRSRLKTRNWKRWSKARNEPIRNQGEKSSKNCPQAPLIVVIILTIISITASINLDAAGISSLNSASFIFGVFAVCQLVAHVILHLTNVCPWIGSDQHSYGIFRHHYNIITGLEAVKETPGRDRLNYAGRRGHSVGVEHTVNQWYCPRGARLA